MQNKIIKRSKQNTNVRNLLDNSDFRNPVNQRGKTTDNATDWRNAIDRWVFGNVTYKLTTNGITLTPYGSGEEHMMAEYLEKQDFLIGKKLTFAVGLSNGDVCIATGTVPKKSDWAQIAQAELNGVMLSVMWSGGTNYLMPRILVGKETTVTWAALYEGEYTAENLPEYQPKGYGAELAECQRYYIKISSNSWTYCAYPNGTGFAIATIPTKYPMRVTPQVTGKCSIFADLGWINDLIPRIENTITGYNIIITPDTSNMTPGKVYIICGEIELNADL